jgi:hypothetical protein
MNPTENLTPLESPNKNKSERPQPPFDPIEQRLEGCVYLINNEYKNKY